MNRLSLVVLCFAMTACATTDEDSWPFNATPVSQLKEPWAMTFLPDGRLLVTEKAGRVLIVTQDGAQSAPLDGVPDVDYGGQGGLGDVVLHPDFADNKVVYLSYAEAGDDDTRGAAVARGTLALNRDGWRRTERYDRYLAATSEGHRARSLRSPTGVFAGWLFIHFIR